MPKKITDRLKIRDVPAYIYSKTGVTKSRWIVYYWIKNGKHTYSNKLIKPKTEKICGQMFTRKSWIDEFLQELEV